jgi:polyribonucleotide nucleotidyltransferase
MRVVADTLESDGSTSMATVCSSILALMDAGVPVKNMVAGTAMGMLKSGDGFTVITDIAAIEDELGLMDFKIAGTENQVTAIQMDIKYKGGLSREVFRNALDKAKKARLHILGKMRETLTGPRKQLSANAPQFVSFKIPKDKIGAVIGSGGKVIREITEKTHSTINIEDDGTVKIFGSTGEHFEKAIAWVKAIGGDIAPGLQINGIIKKHTEFGCFVELFPNVDGLVHISTIPKNEQQNFKMNYREGDRVDVVVVEYDQATGRIRLKILK